MVSNDFDVPSSDLLKGRLAVVHDRQVCTGQNNHLYPDSNKFIGTASNKCDARPTYVLDRTTHSPSTSSSFDVWMGFVSPTGELEDVSNADASRCIPSSDDEETVSLSNVCSSSPYSFYPYPVASEGGYENLFNDEADPWDLAGIIRRPTDDSDPPTDCRRSCSFGERTPGLSNSSTSPPSDSIPPTPGSDVPIFPNPAKSSGSHALELGKRRASPLEQGDETTSGSVAVSHRNTNKQKRAPKDIKSVKPIPKDGQNEALVPLVSSRLFDTKFLLEYFDFAYGFDDDKTWRCPFPLTAAINADCQKELSADELQLHLRKHCASFEKCHTGQKLSCPLKDKDNCNWRDGITNQGAQAGLNSGFARHILDGHYEARRVRCPCGKSIGRAVKDQLVRHLLAPQHQTKLSEKRNADSSFPAYLNIRNPALLERQGAWKRGTAEDAREDKEEGSSNGRKRVRHS